MILNLAGKAKDGEATRALLLAIIMQEPGINKNQLRKRVGLSWTATAYQLRRLQDRGRIRLVRLGRNGIHCFPGDASDRWMHWLASMRDDRSRRILEALRPGEWVGVADLQKRLQLSEEIIARQLEHMVQGNILEKRGTYRPRFALRADMPANFTLL